MTEEEECRFALVLKECERLRAVKAQEGGTCLIAQSGRMRRGFLETTHDAALLTRQHHKSANERRGVRNRGEEP